MFEQFQKLNFSLYLPMLTDYALKSVGAILLFVIAVFIAGRMKSITYRALQHGKLDQTLVKFFSNAVKWSILTVAIISILGLFGVETASFAAVIAAAGLAIGLAFQGTLSNFAAGVMLLVFRPFHVGQHIKVSGESGIVDEISIFTTTIDTFDKRRIILPNSSIFGSKIENVSHHVIRRCDVEIGTSYSADLEKTKTVFSEVIREIEEIHLEPEPAIVLTSLGESSINWALRVYLDSENYWKVRERLLWNCKNALDKNGIGIPFPQRDVHLYNAKD